MLTELFLIKNSQQEFEVHLFDDSDVAYDLSAVVSATVVIKESTNSANLLVFESGTNLTIDTGKLMCNTTKDIDWTDVEGGVYIAEVKLEDGDGVVVISETFNVKIQDSLSV